MKRVLSGFLARREKKRHRADLVQQMYTLMDDSVEELERKLRNYLRVLPLQHDFDHEQESLPIEFIETLFQFLTRNNPKYLRLLFPNGPPAVPGQKWSLREAQGAEEGSEYTESARGHACGHVFQTFEPSYHCRTCAVDGTCVLCAKCFDASDHSSHSYTVTLNHFGAGCCDCGDPEAWNNPPPCAIHTPHEHDHLSSGQQSNRLLPDDLINSITMTINVVLDYLVDVWSCSPEQLRLPKTAETITEDLKNATLDASKYGGSDPVRNGSGVLEYGLVIWNDEKHTVPDVADTVKRAIRITTAQAVAIAFKVDRVGRAEIKNSASIDELLKAAKIIEDPRLSVSIRARRDIFREEMCWIIVDWLSDINGCRVGPDGIILKNTICAALLSTWNVGVTGPRRVGEDGLYDHDREDVTQLIQRSRHPNAMDVIVRLQDTWDDDEHGDDDSEDETLEDLLGLEPEDDLEAREATMAGYPPPPPPPALPGMTVADSAEAVDGLLPVPRTPHHRKTGPKSASRPSKYWLEKPVGFQRKPGLPPAEDLWQRTRLDFIILYDLRMWKTFRVNLRELLVRTVITVPSYKRLVAIRFASVYTVLAELHLIADREPDHSMIYLTLQLLTTPSITGEIVESANFLTNLLAILYSFLTTRQVGYPAEINLNAAFAIDQGVTFNRRSTCFYQDLKHLISSDVVKQCIQAEPRYLSQFLDLAKIHQGLCPNVRAAQQHVEYEMETWMNILTVMTELFRITRSFTESFKVKNESGAQVLLKSINTTAGVTIYNSLGMDRQRFEHAEFKRATKFKLVDPLEFDVAKQGSYKIVSFAVDSEPISCYHPLHYILSWLIAEAKTLDPSLVKAQLNFPAEDLQSEASALRSLSFPKHELKELKPEDNLLALFDTPIRVLAWLSQARAGMWVRNGQSLRQQLSQYRSQTRRDLTQARDIFMIQTAFVVCDPSTILMTLLDRYDLQNMAEGDYGRHEPRDPNQSFDIAEDLAHLLIVMLCDRLLLIPCEDEAEQAAKLEIVHGLCLKPLSFHDLRKALTEPTKELVEKGLLEKYAHLKSPETLTDRGKITLKEEFMSEVDPYCQVVARNNREETELQWRKHMAQAQGKPLEQVFFVPNIKPIPEGTLFADITAFTSTSVFAQMMFYFTQAAVVVTPDVAPSKLEQFYHVLLHLILVAAMSDTTTEDSMSDDSKPASFCEMALSCQAHRALSVNTLAALLRRSMELDHLKTCSPKVKYILKLFEQKRPSSYRAWKETVRSDSNDAADSGTATPSGESVINEREIKRKRALDRAMSNMKEQQNKFLQNQAIDWGLDDDDMKDDIKDEDGMEIDQLILAKQPELACLVCQGSAESDHYGTFAYIGPCQIFRNTPDTRKEWVREVFEVPENLDQQFKERPFGFAKKNKVAVTKKMHNGQIVETVKTVLGKGFPTEFKSRASTSTGCGHVMHFGCWSNYVDGVRRKHLANITRRHPESIERGEFLCPLCKAMCNVFLPITWKPQSLVNPSILQYTGQTIDDWLKIIATQIGGEDAQASLSDASSEYIRKSFGQNRFAAPWNDLFDKKLQDDEWESAASVTDALLRENEGLPILPADLRASILNTQETMNLMGTLGQLGLTINGPTGPVTGNAIARPGPMTTIELLNEASITSPGSQNQNNIADFAQLEMVYGRIFDALLDNGIEERDWNITDISKMIELPRQLFTLLGQSITAVEIAQRGVSSDKQGSSLAGPCTLLNSISDITLMHLRVLSESIQSVLAVLATSEDGRTVLDHQRKKYNGLLHGIFTSTVSNVDDADLDSSPNEYTIYQSKRNLLTDPLVLLTELSNYVGNSIGKSTFDMKNAMKYFLLTEIVRGIAFFCVLGGNAEILLDESPGSLQDAPKGFATLVELLLAPIPISRGEHELGKYAESMKILKDRHILSIKFLDTAGYKPLYAAIRKYALPFVRKCLIFMHVAHNIDFENASVDEDWRDLPELEKLLGLLGLPSLEDLIMEVVQSPDQGFVKSMQKLWILPVNEIENTRSRLRVEKLTLVDDTSGGAITADPSKVAGLQFGMEASDVMPDQDRLVKFLRKKSQFLIGHPGIYELVGLPQDYISLQETGAAMKCLKTGRPITDPAICLECGEIFCGQTQCCMEKRSGQFVGGSWLHREKCSGSTGVFLLIRKYHAMVTHRIYGMFAFAPYVDKWGEIDPAYRSSSLLTLNQKRYDSTLRQHWLQKGLESMVARKLESDNNQGGWETL